MSIMSSAVARTRSSSADIRGGLDERLSRVPKSDEERDKTAEDSASEENTKPKPKVVVAKKETKKSKLKAVKPPAVARKTGYEEEETEVDDYEGETQWDATSRGTEREDDCYGGSETEEETTEDGFNLGTAYEILKFRSTEPATRPPIIKRKKEAMEGLRWAANDCAVSSAALRRARPERPLAAAFFDRLELVRRVLLAEIAKAPSVAKAMAAVGVAIDREMLLVAAEEIYSKEVARSKVLHTKPGNFEELAADLGVALRRPRYPRTARGQTGWRRGTQQAPLSKPKKPCVPFRERGVEPIHQAWRPRATSAPPARAVGRGRHSRQHEPELDGMETLRGTEDGGAVAEERRATAVARNGTIPRERGKARAGRGDKKGNRGTCQRWSIQKGGGDGRLSDVLNTKERWNQSPNPRFKKGEQAHCSSAFYSAWRPGSRGSHKEFEVARSAGPATWLSTGRHGAERQTVLGGDVRGRDSRVHGAAIWAEPLALHIHTADELACEGNQEALSPRSRSVYRRLPLGKSVEGGTRARHRRSQGVLRRARGPSVGEEGDQAGARGGLHRVQMEQCEEDDQRAKGEKERVSKGSEEFTKAWADKGDLAESGRKAGLPPRSSGADNAARVQSAPCRCKEERPWQTLGGARRGKGRPRVVAREAERGGGTGTRHDPRDGKHRVRRERWKARLSNQHRGRADKEGRRRALREEPGLEDPRGPHKSQRDRGDFEGPRESPRDAPREAFGLVHRFVNSAGRDKAAGNAEAIEGHLGDHKESVGPGREGRDKASSEAGPREVKRGGRRAVATWRGKDRMGADHRGSDKRMGPAAGGPVRRHQGAHFAVREFRVGRQKNALASKGPGHRRGDEVPRALRRGHTPMRKARHVGADGGVNNTPVARRMLVADAREDASGVPRPRQVELGGYKEVARKERAAARVDSILDSAGRPLWAERTRGKHAGILVRFLLWQEREGLAPQSKEEERTRTARGLTRYIHALAGVVSGEALVVNARSLLASLGALVGSDREERIRTELPLLRREANRKNPPRAVAAEAVSMGDLRELVAKSGREKLSRGERMAVDIFLIAFVTMSRVGEIVALEVDNVAADGSTLALRPKTGAKTWRRLTKCVSNTRGLRAADKLRKYRQEAIKAGRKELFVTRKGRQLETTKITARLKRASKKLGIAARITSHSARKGAAVEALLAGVPVPVIQALGGWKDINTLQAYLGEAVRRTTSVLDVLRGKERTRRKRSQGRKSRTRARWRTKA